MKDLNEIMAEKFDWRINQSPITTFKENFKHLKEKKIFHFMCETVGKDLSDE